MGTAIKVNSVPERHKDSFGFLRTALVGITTWTDRQLRSTGVVLPHIAKGDVFSYNVQLNHDKKLQENCDGFHLHAVPVGEVTAGEVISFSYAWGYYSAHNVIPDTLPNTGTATYTLKDGEQFAHLIIPIVNIITPVANEGYSSFVLIKVTRLNDESDTYASEFALLGADVHYISDRNGSVLEYSDSI